MKKRYCIFRTVSDQSLPFIYNLLKNTFQEIKRKTLHPGQNSSHWVDLKEISGAMLKAQGIIRVHTCGGGQSDQGMMYPE